MEDSFLPDFNSSAPPPTALMEPEPTTVPAIQAPPPPLTSMNGEKISPDLLASLVAQLKPYIESTTVEVVSQAMHAVVPDVVEATLERIAPQVSTPPAPVAHRQIATTPDDFADYLPGRYQGDRPGEKKADWAAWAAMGAIVAVLAATISVVATQGTPSASTERVISNQGEQIEHKDLLIKDLANRAARSNCKLFCF